MPRQRIWMRRGWPRLRVNGVNWNGHHWRVMAVDSRRVGNVGFTCPRTPRRGVEPPPHHNTWPMTPSPAGANPTYHDGHRHDLPYRPRHGRGTFLQLRIPPATCRLPSSAGWDLASRRTNLGNMTAYHAVLSWGRSPCRFYRVRQNRWGAV